MGWNKRSFGLKGHKYTRGAVIRAPSTLTAAVDDTSGGIELTASEVSGADSYSYYYAVDSGDWQSAATGQTTSYTFVPSEAGEYSFGVTAVKGSAESRKTTLVPGSLFDDVPNDEGIALMAFYEATGGDAWTTNTNWLTATTVNTYYGVTVSGGAVTAIDLSSNNLVGAVGTTLDDLTLTSLDLTGNTLTGKILIADPGDTRLATADGAAAFRSGTYDLSGYTSHKLTVIDSSGLEAVAYGYQADDAESMDTNIAPVCGGFTDKNKSDSCTDRIWTFTHNSGYNDLLRENNITQTGYVYWLDFSLSITSGKLSRVDVGGYCSITYDSSGRFQRYGTGQSEDKNRLSFVAAEYFGDIEIHAFKKLLSFGTDALQLRNASTGTTRNMVSVDAGFGFNNIATIEIEAL